MIGTLRSLARNKHGLPLLVGQSRPVGPRHFRPGGVRDWFILLLPAAEGMDGFVEQPAPREEWGSLAPSIHLPLLPCLLHHPVTRGPKETEFQKTKEACLNYIQDALLQNQWQRAAEFMISYLEILETSTVSKRKTAPEAIWRIGTEILLHHSKSNIEELNYFTERMKNLGVKYYLKVCLEHIFYLLCNGLIDEAYQNLTLAESWRYGEQTAAQNDELKLIQAYKGLLDYYNWSKKREAMLELDEENFTDSSEQEMHNFFRQAAVNLKEIIKIPGVWDPFVVSYVDLLEFYGDFDEAREVLTEYAYNSKFPPNPNAHAYLYHFLKRRGESKKSLVSVLKILHKTVPSHELMLEFYTMLKKSKKDKKRRLGLEVIFEVLDFAGWKENVKAWSCLAEQIKQILDNSNKHLDWVKEEWNSRKDWWPAFHFSHYLAKRNWQENEKLAYEKALLAGILLGKDCKYYKYVLHQGCKAKKKRFQTLKKFVKKHNSAYLRITACSDSSTHL
ncbi:TATA box-binding protein-associated factor RNA polymerase I subunit A isoform X2 [Alligator mississippiensis]|nr:TATA box-binding protein-associated factor RNA polymerase I subunit A isoform X2 [Alligator mississippiensis]